jgi:hypothetical protein
MKSLRTLLLSAALVSVAGVAFAADTTVSTSVEHLSFDLGGVKTESNLLKTELSGIYAGGFSYSLTLSAGDLSTDGVIAADAEASYLFRGLAGPAVAHEWSEVAGVASRRTLVGVAGSYDLGKAITLDGTLLSDVDAFGDDINLNLGGRYAFSSKISFSGELDIDRVNKVDFTTGKVGMGYKLTDGASIGGKVIYGGSSSANTVRGFEAGINLSF